MSSVLVTGIGPMSCIGKSSMELFCSLQESRCGIRSVQEPWIRPEVKSRVASIVPEFNFSEYVSELHVLQLLSNPYSRTAQLGIAAAVQAVRDSDIDLKECDRSRVGVVVGTFGNLDYIAHLLDQIRNSTANAESAFLGFPGTIAGIISSMYDIKGPADTVSGGCPSGMDAIGWALRSIATGIIDVAIVIGVDNEFCEITFNGIAAGNGLSSKYNDDPGSSSRPFDLNRGGNVIGENACAVLIEKYEHAIQRKAKNIYAAIAGYSKTSAGKRIYDPEKPALIADPSIRAFHSVLNQCGWLPNDVDLISANGSASVSYDRLESQAIEAIFGKNTPVHSIKGMCGQSGSGCTILQIAAACICLQKKIIYGTKNFENHDPTIAPLNIIRNFQSAPNLRRIICQAIALGGFHYSCLGLESIDVSSLSSKL